SKNLNLTNKNSYKNIDKIIEENDIILFAAAEAPVKNEKMFLNNIIMLQNLIRSKKIIKIKNFIYVSSDAVYSDSQKPLNESSLTKPTNLHGLMHLTREITLQSLFKSKLTIVRPTLIYGHGDPHNGYGPNKFLRESNKFRRINLFGKGEEIRDHVSIDDVALIIFNLLLYENNGIINIVSGYRLSFLDIAKKIKKTNKNNTIINFNPRIGPMPHNGYRVFDNTNLINLFPKLKLNNFLKNYF
ncbi:NAD(P)-dependent oxidoreductase, partial [Pelagibacteraceae bacterium]|nr:NAD(P)-dependent oxidoreductase [Pelagibacteraceae bacterium]